MSPQVPRARRARPRAGRLLAVLGIVATSLTGLAPSAAGAVPWGTQGASYLGGIVCSLPGGTRVPMVAWTVDGTRAFATADVRADGTNYGPAPTSGTAAPLAPGQAGIPGGLIASVAYLVTHHGSGSNAEIAETSAEVAAAAGGGSAQAACLGQQGTSRAHAASLWADAQRFAGPYTLTVAAASGAAPQQPAQVNVRVVSAAGVPTPGIPVTVTAAGQTAGATTGTDGTATASIIAPRIASTPVTATVQQPIGLTGFGTNPASVTAAAPVTATAQGTLTVNLHPHPSVTATPTAPLLLKNGSTALTVHLSGTASFPGSGTVEVVGPVQPRAGGLCSSLQAGDYARAPTAWKGSFVFARDGDIPAGSTGPLAAGCYATRATVAIPSSSPPASASSGLRPEASIEVSTMTLGQQVGAVAPPGALTSTLTANDPGAARVTGRVTTYGPLPTSDGRCAAITDWTHARQLGTSGPVALSRSGAHANQLAARVAAPAVTAGGCYTVAPQLTVALDGRSLVVTTPPGGPGTQTLVVTPTVTVADDTYDGTVGRPMAATATVAGTYRLPGTLRVGLLSAPVPFDGCRSAQFPTTAPRAVTTTRTTGDGTVAIRTPVATRNRCYALAATFVLDGNHDVRANAPAPESDTVFLAGIMPTPVGPGAIPGGGGGVQLRALVVFGSTLLLMLVLAFGMVAAARRGRRTDAARSDAVTDAADLFDDPQPGRLARV